jgi:hypothetical protein
MCHTKYEDKVIENTKVFNEITDVSQKIKSNMNCSNSLFIKSIILDKWEFIGLVSVLAPISTVWRIRQMIVGIELQR